MRKTGPLRTLFAGLVVALALALFGRPGTAGSPGDDPTPSVARPVAGAAAAPAAGRATYAARVPGSRAVLALTVRGRSAIAYVCDGVRLEAWLRGTVYPEGLLRLQGPRGVLTGSVDGRTFVGAAALKGTKVLAFEAAAVRAPSGLYRATATVRGARFVGGWIVLPSGRQVGLATLAGASRPAPPLDPAQGAVELDGVRIPVAPADPAGP